MEKMCLLNGNKRICCDLKELFSKFDDLLHSSLFLNYLIE